MILAESDLDEAAESVLSAHDQRVAALPQDLCVAVQSEARTLETELLSIYRIVAIGVRNEADFENVSKWWGKMKTICDECLVRLSTLCKSNQPCGIEAYYDRVLDVRNRCSRFEERHS